VDHWLLWFPTTAISVEPCCGLNLYKKSAPTAGAEFLNRQIFALNADKNNDEQQKETNDLAI
jgi:hypothetical protein